MDKTTKLSDRARAWYDAAYRRWASAEACGGFAHDEFRGDAYARIAARYARLASA